MVILSRHHLAAMEGTWCVCLHALPSPGCLVIWEVNEQIKDWSFSLHICISPSFPPPLKLIKSCFPLLVKHVCKSLMAQVCSVAQSTRTERAGYKVTRTWPKAPWQGQVFPGLSLLSADTGSRTVHEGMCWCFKAGLFSR